MLPIVNSFDALNAEFAWDIPEFYNIGVDICDRWADRDPDRIAIIDVKSSGKGVRHSFANLRDQSNRLAHALSRLGIGKSGAFGDRVGVLLPQCVETALSHIALSKMGCISIPLFTLFERLALLHRLRDAGAVAVITDATGAAKIASLRNELPELRHVICIDNGVDDTHHFDTLIADESIDFTPNKTRADDPALLIYTSGTTGNPKGALHAHRVLLGHLPGVETSHNFIGDQGDVFWTPADWAWIGGLLDVMMPALHHGASVIAHRFEKFDGIGAFELMRKHGVTNSFLPPTALKMMRKLENPERYALNLRAVASGGESLGADLLEWGNRAFGVAINEFYGQTECNMIVSSCAGLEPVAAGIMGRGVVGHNVAIINETTGAKLPADTEGAIGVKSPDPVMFLGYWNNETATAEKFVSGADGKWLLTGDRGLQTPSGHFQFIGRDDDVISSAGYRIGPAEIEDCITTHKAVQFAGVVGKPDATRGSVIAAYVTLIAGFEPNDELAGDIAGHVKSQLAAYEYPRVVRFLDEMPMTTTGKIIRHELRALAKAEAASEEQNG
ncbi:acetyl-CoA synthetase [Amylibacter ulvae]|uniref:Acetyl-CoA synthetase n=1 Tax=Paramylibacter ulvae TaxID=1651968 RepID=A0ABQ3CZD7_9RHOB|nr:AMP-binding protein [Amylibacter ulvae]GHA51176.1 acetyl-CoA synthetase [Amylibacter ulvae]